MTNSGELICPKCAHHSPPGSKACHRCGSHFPVPIMLGQAAPPKLRPSDLLIPCDGCGRECAPDARICDWCGVALKQAVSHECAICAVKLPVFVTYCGECGVYLDPPPRLDPRNAGLGEQCHQLQFDQLPRWSTHPLPTFTYDEHVPSKTTPTPVKIIQKTKAIQAPPIIKPLRDRLGEPMVTRLKNKAISPGGGFWRQQVEFACDNHARRVKESAEYRQQIADLKLGQLITHELAEAARNDEQKDLCIKLRFAKCDHPDYPSSMEATVRDLYQVSEKTKKEAKQKQTRPQSSKKMKVPKKTDPAENAHLSVSFRLFLDVCLSDLK